MFDYTKALYQKTLDDISAIRNAYKIFNICAQLLFIAYQIYILVIGNAIWYAHLSLLIVSVAFFVFDIVTSDSIKSITETISHKKERRSAIRALNKKRKLVSKIKKYVFYALKAFILGTSIYTIVVDPQSASVFSIVSTTVMTMILLADMAFAVIKRIVTDILENRINMFKEALKADVASPLNKAKDFFKKITGQESDEPAPSKEQSFLDKLVEQNKEAGKKKIAAWFEAHIQTKKSGDDEFITVSTDEDDE